MSEERKNNLKNSKEKLTRSNKYSDLRDSIASENQSREKASKKVTSNRSEKYSDIRKDIEIEKIASTLSREKIDSNREEKYSKSRKTINVENINYTKKSNIKKKTILVTVVALIIISAVVLTLIRFKSINKETAINISYANSSLINDLTSEVEKNQETIFKEKWSENKSYNVDYVGQLIFDSGLIDVPFVQSSDNEIYLRRDFKTGIYSDFGTVFMDYECELDNQNIILYGHNVFSTYNNGLPVDDENKMFTPLTTLVKQENYEQNKTIYMVLENEYREYKIVSVYYCGMIEEKGINYPESDLYYNLVSYDKEYFETYKNKIKEVEFYNTGVDFTYEDSLLTLQTCIEEDENKREIVLCKLIAIHKFEDVDNK